MVKNYGKKSQEFVEEAMREYEEGKLTIGKSDKKVENSKQAIAIGLSEARKHGVKVPPPKGAEKKKDASDTRKGKNGKSE